MNGGYIPDLSGLFVWLLVLSLVGGVALIYWLARAVLWLTHHVHIA